MNGQTISHYRIQEKLGGGGMGVVYRAEDTKLGRGVALKFLPEGMHADPAAVERFQREARAASALNHPNICTIYESTRIDSRPFIAMELPRRRNRSSTASPAGALRHRRRARLRHANRRRARRRAHPRHRASRYQARQSFHHPARPAKILDFGLAKLLSQRDRFDSVMASTGAGAGATAGDMLTSPGSTLGTIAYMSPEQAKGEPLDARTDLFSFGVVLYEMTTGRMAFDGSTSALIFDAILHKQAKSIQQLNPELPNQLERIISKALEKDREMRYQAAAELRTDLKRLKRDLDSASGSSGHKSAQTAALKENSGVISAKAEKSVAVLYFENLSSAKEDEYFRDGMTEDIITELSKVKDLRVFPRPAVAQYRDKSVTAPQVGHDLSAAYVLGGSLRRAGNRVRISAQLIETRTGHTSWAERYDREMEDVFEVQDEIARAIAQAFRITLSPQEQKAIAAKPTQNVEAYDYYLRGRSYARRENRADLELAMEMYERAIRIDPKFALAYAGLANVCGLFHDWYGHDNRWIERGEAACRRITDLDPELPESFAAHARIAWAQRKYAPAIDYAQKAIARKSDCEGAYWSLGQALFATDRFQEAADLAERAIESSGDDYNVYIPFIYSLERIGRKEAVRELRKKWTRVVEQQVEVVPDDTRARGMLANNYAVLGQREAALREVDMVLAMRPNDSNIIYNSACIYGIFNQKKEALDLLRKARDTGFPNLDWAARDPDLVCLHDDPEFQALLSSKSARNA